MADAGMMLGRTKAPASAEAERFTKSLLEDLFAITLNI
jgi:hypothetical protein